MLLVSLFFCIFLNLLCDVPLCRKNASCGCAYPCACMNFRALLEHLFAHLFYSYVGFLLILLLLFFGCFCRIGNIGNAEEVCRFSGGLCFSCFRAPSKTDSDLAHPLRRMRERAGYLLTLLTKGPNGFLRGSSLPLLYDLPCRLPAAFPHGIPHFLFI